ncbi:MAG TPA: hypothetical protein VKT52_07820 [Ktedonobacterales bacterium]|nr:hypothetical protein [Ktedonobacterales bacterium]
MRLARLPQDNPRTQGPARRRWYQRYSPDHLLTIAASVESALTSRAPAAPGAAVVLGAGACTEVPLWRLAEVCDSVLLVDVDVTGMAQARDELPAHLRPRVNLLQADLTSGVSAALAADLRAQPWADLVTLAGPSGAAPLDAAAACLDRCPIPDPPRIPELAPAGYGLVMSSLVLTQLFSLPLLDVADTLALYASTAVELREDHPRYREAALRFRRHIALAHLDLIGALLAPEGCGLLVTDVTGYLLPPQSGPHAGTTAESLPVLPPEAMALPEDVARRFELVDRMHIWRWLVSAPDATTPGRAYDVASLLFRHLPHS